MTRTRRRNQRRWARRAAKRWHNKTRWLVLAALAAHPRDWLFHLPRGYDVEIVELTGKVHRFKA